MPTRAEQSTESNEPRIYREWAYMVQLIGKSWAGSYSNAPFVGKAGTAGDGSHVAARGGQEGRVTGGVANGYTEADIREHLDGLYILRERNKDKDGNEQEIVTQTYRLLSLEPRTVLFTQ